MRSLSQAVKQHRPLLINPSHAQSFLERCASLQLPLGAKASDLGDMLEVYFGAKPVLEKFPPFAVIPIRGVIGRGLSELESLCGACDIKDVEEMLEECERDMSIKTIIIDIDSPGGTSVGVPELANRIKNCKKSVIAFTASECCSAAYWIGSQAGQGFYATPSSTVGSVGVYIAFPDMSEAYKMEGVRMDVIRAGAMKGAGIPGTSLDAGQREMLQAEVLEIWGDFKAAVKSVREFVEDASMEGQTFSGKKAADAGLVTSLVNGFDEMMVTLDAAVAEQMEADEDNDARHAEAAESAESEDDEGDEYEMKRYASARALKGIAKSALVVKAESEGEGADEEEGEGVPPAPDAGKLPVKMGDPTDPDDPDYDPDLDPSAKCVVSDFDGTIRVDDSDMLDKAVSKHLDQMSEAGHAVHIVTGRHESRRDETSAYLKKHSIKHVALHMKADDNMPTPEYKVKAAKHIEEKSGPISHIIENDKACTEAYEAAGYHCVHPDTLGKAEDESDASEKSVETDADSDKSDAKRHKSRGIA